MNKKSYFNDIYIFLVIFSDFIQTLCSQQNNVKQLKVHETRGKSDQLLSVELIYCVVRYQKPTLIRILKYYGCKCFSIQHLQ